MLKSVSVTFSSPAGLVQSSRDLRPVPVLQSLLRCYVSSFSLCCDFFLYVCVKWYRPGEYRVQYS